MHPQSNEPGTPITRGVHREALTYATNALIGFACCTLVAVVVGASIIGIAYLAATYEARIEEGAHVVLVAILFTTSAVALLFLVIDAFATLGARVRRKHCR